MAIIHERGLGQLRTFNCFTRSLVSREHDPNLEATADNRTRMEDFSIDWSNITVLVKDAPGAFSFKKPYMITKVLLHEIGHALGLHGHSPNPQDVMFPAATSAQFATLSKRDINTIRIVYNLPPADPQVQGLIYVRGKNFAKAIECFNAALKEHPNSWQILQNIGGCKMELGQTDQAIDCFERSVKLGGLHHVSQCMSLAFAYQKAEKNSKVWDWLQTACWMDPATAANPEIQATIKKLEYPIEHPSGSPDAPDYLAGLFKADKWKMDGPVRDRLLLAKICLHEMGHALGMNGHSPNSHDVMYPSSSIYDKSAPVLSARDKSTIRRLYQTIK